MIVCFINPIAALLKRDLLLFNKSRRFQYKLLKIHYSLLKLKSDSTKNVYYIYKRSYRIIDFFAGKKILVYNGRMFKKLTATKNHSGFFFGEFSFTRRYGFGVDMHKRRKKKVK